MFQQGVAVVILVFVCIGLAYWINKTTDRNATLAREDNLGHIKAINNLAENVNLLIREHAAFILSLPEIGVTAQRVHEGIKREAEELQRKIRE